MYYYDFYIIYPKVMSSAQNSFDLFGSYLEILVIGRRKKRF